MTREWLDYLRARPDRCNRCGFHTFTQGHRPGCPHYPTGACPDTTHSPRLRDDSWECDDCNPPQDSRDETFAPGTQGAMAQEGI